MAKVTDPVCGMELDSNEVVAQSTHLGQTYSFCSEECKRIFDENPTEYFGNVPGGDEEPPAPR